MENKQKRRFFFRNTDRPDALAEDKTPNLLYFFKLLGRNAGKLMSLNLMMAVLYLPIIAMVVLYFFGATSATISEPLNAPVLGALIAKTTPLGTVFAGMNSVPLHMPYFTLGKKIAYLVLILFTAVTWGWQNVGATYNLRSLVRGDSCFLFSDYFYAVRKNLKQGFFFGLLDFAINFLLIFDFFYFSALSGQLFFGVMYFFFAVLFILYTFMRFYLYHMMVTFDLSIRKLLKNALIFAVIGIKRNIVAGLGLLLVIVLNLALIIPLLGVGFSLPIILPIFYFPALSGFIAAYAAWPNIRRYMIDGNAKGESADAATFPQSEN